MAAIALPDGNRCFHTHTDPDLLLDNELAERAPKILRRLSEYLDSFYISPRVYLPSLDLVNRSQRQQRSERRESCIRLLKAMISCCDVETLRVGFYSKEAEAVTPIGLKKLAEIAGLSFSRAKRAHRDLVRAGIVKIHQVRQKRLDGNWEAFPAMRWLSPLLFTAFSLDQWLARERKGAKKRREKRQAAKPVKINRAARSAMMVTGVIASTKIPKTARRQTQQSFAIEQEKTRLLGELHQKHPQLTIPELARLADEHLARQRQ